MKINVIKSIELKPDSNMFGWETMFQGEIQEGEYFFITKFIMKDHKLSEGTLKVFIGTDTLEEVNVKGSQKLESDGIWIQTEKGNFYFPSQKKNTEKPTFNEKTIKIFQ